ncbi:MAG: hypothetical protein NTX53_03045 [candidate division WOR-3 bacterium]|nr:hypothetical protein [candidate division WOR-3 bacterium]
MAHRSRRLPGNDHSADEALRRFVAASGLMPGQEEAGMAFSRELDASIRHGRLGTRSEIPGRISVMSPPPDFSRRTKLVTMKWFRRGLSGRALWRIGQAVMEWRFGLRR